MIPAVASRDPAIQRVGSTTRIDVGTGSIEVVFEGGVLLTRYVGRLTLASADALIGVLDRIARDAQFESFNDAIELTGYDSEFRVRLTDWVGANKTSVPHLHVLLKSRIVAMAVSVAGLAIGSQRITSYSDPKAFAIALASRRKSP